MAFAFYKKGQFTERQAEDREGRPPLVNIENTTVNLVSGESTVKILYPPVR
jgi:hypothetical protein